MNVAPSIKPYIKPTLYPILLAIGFAHLVNDTMQSVIPAIFPILKLSLDLTYTQIGFILFALNITASVLQPVIGLYSDSRPTPMLLPIGMTASLIGMLGLGLAPNYPTVIVSVVLIGVGSAVFHPEGARVSYMAAGSRRGLAQSIFQVGGNSGQALAPVMTALIFAPLGQIGAVWFTIVAAAGIAVLILITRWYSTALQSDRPVAKKPVNREAGWHRRRRLTLIFSFVILIVFAFARTWYHAGITALYPFHLMNHFGFKLEEAQLHIFLFLAAGAAGTFIGGPLSDRFGKRNILIFSMLGSAPFALAIPWVSPFWAYPLCLIVGLIILSSFSVMVVYAQELLPGKVGTVSGLIIGLAFGLGAIGAAALGFSADHIGLDTTLMLISFLPLSGLIALLLPSDRKLTQWAEETTANEHN